MLSASNMSVLSFLSLSLFSVSIGSDWGHRKENIMLNGKPLISMDRRNVVVSIVQDRSKLQTLTPTIFKMSTQQQPTAEKSVQTQDSSSGATAILLKNNLATHFHAENAATEVANTLVSMATGRQGVTNNHKTPTIVNVSKANPLPILSLSDYTTSHGVPTAMALASQAKISPSKQENHIEDEDVSMSTDELNFNSPNLNDSKSNRTKSNRSKFSRTSSTTKSREEQNIETIQYGPILVKPRKSVAPTLASGRRSKDEPLPPDEDQKRKMRRDRNKQAAAKCRQKRNELRQVLEQEEQRLLDEQRKLQNQLQKLDQRKFELETILQQQMTARKTRLSIPTTTGNPVNIPKTEVKTIPTSTLLDANGNEKRVTINITNAQDLFSVGTLTRVTPTLTTTDGLLTSSSTVPMITIHIIPEMAQALLGSASVDKKKLVELLQQANASVTIPTTTTVSESTISNTNSTTNSTS